MLGDYFTKPLQGGLFTKFRDRILNIQSDPLTVPPEDHRSVLGQGRSHATGQSQGQSQATVYLDQTNCPKSVKQPMERVAKQSLNQQNVHTVMTPMSQPVGGWHVTSMTGQARSTMSDNMLRDHVNKTIG